jgi:hypothetical protein
VPEDNFLEISQFILLPSVDGKASTFVAENNNNDNIDQNKYTDYKNKKLLTVPRMIWRYKD